MNVCGACKHWYKRPPASLNLAEPPLGECRAGPPQLLQVPVRGGVATQVCYPITPDTFPACALYALGLLNFEAAPAVAMSNG